MKVYVCPVCDHAMRGRHYCRICHHFVKEPYFIDKDYSLDRTSAEPNVCGCDVHTETSGEQIARKRTMQREMDKDYQEAYGSSYDEPEKKAALKSKKREKRRMSQKRDGGIQKNKRRYRTVWMIVVVYIIFQVGMAVAGMNEAMFEELKSGFGGLFSEKLQKEETINKEQEEIVSNWTYETPDYDEVMEKGEESTGLEHFDIDGQEFTDKLQQELNDADFDILETAQYMENYIAVNSEQGEEYSYFQNINTFYLSEDYMEYYRITKDSVSGRLIDAEIESSDYDQVCFFTESAVSLLFSDNGKKQKRIKRLENYLEKLLGEETYFSEKIGKIIISGYVYTNDQTNAYHISLSRTENR